MMHISTERPIPQPGELWGLLDMLKISASKFVHAMEYFGRIGRLCVNNDDENAISPEKVKENLLVFVAYVEDFIAGFRAPATLVALNDVRDKCNQKNALERDVGYLSQQVFDRFHAEMGDQWLLILSHEHSEYLNEDVAPFGEEIRDAFPDFAEDIDEAAKCLALSRYTACVFHLMRVMERSVHLLAKKFVISIDLRVSTWNDITTAVSNKLNNMPGKTSANKRKKQQYGEAVANLHAVRIAWRNEVMHPKKTYTRKEAATIFGHVEGFLTSLLPLAR